jgi:hypothetical protein
VPSNPLSSASDLLKISSLSKSPSSNKIEDAQVSSTVSCVPTSKPNLKENLTKVMVVTPPKKPRVSSLTTGSSHEKSQKNGFSGLVPVGSRVKMYFLPTHRRNVYEVRYRATRTRARVAQSNDDIELLQDVADMEVEFKPSKSYKHAVTPPVSPVKCIWRTSREEYTEDFATPSEYKHTFTEKFKGKHLHQNQNCSPRMLVSAASSSSYPSDTPANFAEDIDHISERSMPSSTASTSTGESIYGIPFATSAPSSPTTIRVPGRVENGAVGAVLKPSRLPGKSGIDMIKTLFISFQLVCLGFFCCFWNQI